MSLASNDSFTFSFLIWVPIISSSCLMAVARTSKTMLNNSGESEHPYILPNIKGDAFRFCPLSTMLAVGLSYMAFITLRYVPSIPILMKVFDEKKLLMKVLMKVFINWCWISQMVFLHSLI